MNEEPVTVAIRYQAQLGRENVLKRELADLAAIVAAEESACLGIKICQDISDPTRFLLYERWADRATYVGPHMRTPHLQRFIERAGEFLVGPPEITLWHEIGEAKPNPPRSA